MTTFSTPSAPARPLSVNPPSLRQSCKLSSTPRQFSINASSTPTIPLPQLTKTIKGFTAKSANALLGLTGIPFWQEESYDHLVKDATSAERIHRYIENNPVRAGLVHQPGQYKYSSAYKGGADVLVCSGPPGPPFNP